MTDQILLNSLPSHNFKFVINRLPSVNYMMKTFRLPGVTLPSVSQPTPFIKLNIPGDHMDYENLYITFSVDENLKNYLEIYNWLNALGFPDDWDQYKKIKNQSIASGQSLSSDGTIHILSPHKTDNIQIQFFDLNPVSLSSIDLDIDQENIQYIRCTAQFSYTRFKIISPVESV